MTVTRRGSWVSTIPAAATSQPVTMPTHVAGDRLLVVELGKYQGATALSEASGTWFSPAGRIAFPTGQGNGNDSGTCHANIFIKDAASSSETLTLVPGGTAPNSWEFFAAAFPTPPNGWLDAVVDTPISSVTDTVTSSPLAGTIPAFGAGLEPTDGDLLELFGVTPTDTGTALGAVALSNSGLSGGSVAGQLYAENALGQDTGSAVAEWSGFTGIESGDYTASITITSSTAQYGGLVLIALREAAGGGGPAPFEGWGMPIS